MPSLMTILADIPNVYWQILLVLGVILLVSGVLSIWARKKLPGKIIIVGTNQLGQWVGDSLTKYKKVQVISYIDADSLKTDVVGELRDIRPIVQKDSADEVVIALDDHQLIAQLITQLTDLPVQITIVPNYFNWAVYRPKVSLINGIPLISLRSSALNRGQKLCKRLLDIVLTSIALIPLLPVMGVIALAIKLGSDGPILFNQDRIGEQGKHFKIFKFRSMVVNADQMINQVKEESDDGAILYKRKDDPRITKVGKFIRRTSLDELPQLFNVLRGEMSLVGPRPELPWLVEEYKPWQRIRFAVPQGITGWWQINGRSDKPMHLNTSEDLYYVQNYSIWLDLYILLKTPLVVLRGKGAY